MKITEFMREAKFSKMAEAKKNYSNIEKINSLLGAEGIGSLLKDVQGTEKKVGDILRKLSDLENAAKARAQEESAPAEPVVAEAPAKPAKTAPETIKAEEKVQPEPKVEKTEPAKAEPPKAKAEPAAAEEKPVKPVVKAEQEKLVSSAEEKKAGPQKETPKAQTEVQAEAKSEPV